MIDLALKALVLIALIVSIVRVYRLRQRVAVLEARPTWTPMPTSVLSFPTKFTAEEAAEFAARWREAVSEHRTAYNVEVLPQPTAYLKPGDRIHLAIPQRANGGPLAYADDLGAEYAKQGVTVVEWFAADIRIPAVIAVFRQPAPPRPVPADPGWNLTK